MAEFFRTDVVTYDIGQLIDDARIENRTMVLPGIEPHHGDADNDPYDSDYDRYDSGDYDNIDYRIARVEDAIENAIANHRRIEQRRNEDYLGLEQLFLDEPELEYVRMLRDHDHDQYIERSVFQDTGARIWYTNGHFWFL